MNIWIVALLSLLIRDILRLNSNEKSHARKLLILKGEKMKHLLKTITCIAILSGANLASAEQCPPIKINGDDQAQQLWQKTNSFLKQMYEQTYGLTQYCLISPAPIEAKKQDDGTKFTFTEGSSVSLSLPLDEDENETVDISITDEKPSYFIVNDLGNDLLQIKTNYESDALKLTIKPEEENIHMDMSIKIDYDITIHTKYLMALKTTLFMPQFTLTSHSEMEDEILKISLKDIIVNGNAEIQKDTFKGKSNIQLGTADLSIKTYEDETVMFSWQDGKIDSTYDLFSASSIINFRSCLNDASSSLLTEEMNNDEATFALQTCYFDYFKQNLDSSFNSKAVLNNINFSFSDQFDQFDFSSKVMNFHMGFKPNETQQTIKLSYMLDDMDYNTAANSIPEDFKFNNAAITLGFLLNKEKFNAAQSITELDLNDQTLIAGLNLTHKTGAAIDLTSNTALFTDKNITIDNIESTLAAMSPLEYLTTDTTVILTDQATIFSIISAIEPQFKMYGQLINLLGQKEGDNKHKYHLTLKDGTLKVNNKPLPQLF